MQNVTHFQRRGSLSDPGLFLYFAVIALPQPKLSLALLSRRSAKVGSAPLWQRDDIAAMKEIVDGTTITVTPATQWQSISEYGDALIHLSTPDGIPPPDRERTLRVIDGMLRTLFDVPWGYDIDTVFGSQTMRSRALPCIAKQQ